MPPKKKTQFVYPIDKTDDFLKVTAEENQRLSVIDLHLGWCGPCEAMASNYQAIWFAFENPDNRLEFWTVAKENVPEEVLHNLKEGPLTCKPRFLIYKQGEKLAEISGCDFTKLQNDITRFIPVRDD